MHRSLLALLGLSFLTSCASSDQFPAETSAPVTHEVHGLGDHNVQVGEFKDARGGLPANFLGQIQPADSTSERQKIETSQTVEDIVTSTFRSGLQKRDMLASKNPAEWTLSGEITEFTCNQAVRAGATVDIRVRLTKTGSATAAFTHSFTAEQTAAVGPGNQLLTGLAKRTLEEVVNRALDHLELRQVMQEQATIH